MTKCHALAGFVIRHSGFIIHSTIISPFITSQWPGKVQM